MESYGTCLKHDRTRAAAPGRPRYARRRVAMVDKTPKVIVVLGRNTLINLLQASQTGSTDSERAAPDTVLLAIL